MAHKRHIVAVRDRAIDQFGLPVTVSHLAIATRTFGDEVNLPDSVYNKHPEDYDLYHIGDYDLDTGLLTPVTPPRQIAIGKDLKQN